MDSNLRRNLDLECVVVPIVLDSLDFRWVVHTICHGILDLRSTGISIHRIQQLSHILDWQPMVLAIRRPFHRPCTIEKMWLLCFRLEFEYGLLSTHFDQKTYLGTFRIKQRNGYAIRGESKGDDSLPIGWFFRASVRDQFRFIIEPSIWFGCCDIWNLSWFIFIPIIGFNSNWIGNLFKARLN